MVLPPRVARWSFGLSLLLPLASCAVPVAGALDEAQADRVVVALDRAGLSAEKEADPTSEGRYRITVQRDDAAQAIATLHEEDLPTPTTQGLLDAMGKGSMVPSELAEHTQYIAGLDGELERTLQGIDGVLSARVHLSVPMAEPFGDRPAVRPTASVLLKHRGVTPPVSDQQIKQLVAGAAPGLAAADVAVVMLARPLPPALPERELAHIGPIAVTRRSAGWLRTGLLVGVALNVSLVFATLLLWSRVRRLREALGPDDAAPLPQPRRSL